jgi:hypothetical protein
MCLGQPTGEGVKLNAGERVPDLGYDRCEIEFLKNEPQAPLKGAVFGRGLIADGRTTNVGEKGRGSATKAPPI